MKLLRSVLVASMTFGTHAAVKAADVRQLYLSEATSSVFALVHDGQEIKGENFANISFKEGSLYEEIALHRRNPDTGYDPAPFAHFFISIDSLNVPLKTPTLNFKNKFSGEDFRTGAPTVYGVNLWPDKDGLTLKLISETMMRSADLLSSEESKEELDSTTGCVDRGTYGAAYKFAEGYIYLNEARFVGLVIKKNSSLWTHLDKSKQILEKYSTYCAPTIGGRESSRAKETLKLLAKIENMHANYIRRAYAFLSSKDGFATKGSCKRVNTLANLVNNAGTSPNDIFATRQALDQGMIDAKSITELLGMCKKSQTKNYTASAPKQSDGL